MENRVVRLMTNNAHGLFLTTRAGRMTRFETLKAQAFLSQFGDFLVRVKRCEDVAVNRSVAFTTHTT